MELTLRSDRLIMTPLELADVDLVIDLWTDPEVVRFICDVLAEDEIRKEMPDAIRRGGEGAIGVWQIADRNTGEKLGSTYLLPMPTDEDDIDYGLIVMDQVPRTDLEIGYFLKPAAWGQGFATEICRRMLQFAFQEASLGEVVASVHERNIASRKVLEKCGFRHAGRAKCWGNVCPIYKMTREEWMAIRQST
jgi:ribosomal-protein-alanine N-acetyltransferase